jgi:hypothetical protein
MNQVIFKTNKKQIQILLSASLRQLIRFVANSIFVQKWLFIVTPFMKHLVLRNILRSFMQI